MMLYSLKILSHEYYKRESLGRLDKVKAGRIWLIFLSVAEKIPLIKNNAKAISFDKSKDNSK